MLYQVDKGAGQVRSLFITSIPGQDMVYLAKETEAQLIVADPGQGAGVPDNETPHVTAEATAYGVSRFDKAVEILTLRQLWATVSPVIETRRLEAKDAVNAATTAPDVRAAGTVDWSDISAYARA